MNNPLLAPFDLPPFTHIRPEHVVPAVTQTLDEAAVALEQQLDELAASGREPTWKTLVEPIEARDDRINTIWSPISHLNAVMSSDPLREAYEEAQQALTEYYSALGQNRRLYQAYQDLRNSAEYDALSTPQRKTLDNEIRDFKLSGIDLEGDAKARYREIRANLSTLSTQFSNNVLDATQGWYKHVTDASTLAGLPEHTVQAAAESARQRDLEGYVLTLDLPVYFTVITQSENAELRREMYHAFATRCSTEGPTAGQWNNTEIIDTIMTLRRELVGLLGFDHYADYSLATKMAESADQVMNFLNDLADRTRPFAEQELQELQVFAEREYGAKDMQAWDIPFYSEQLKLQKYNISQELLRPYFPVDTVLQGLFRVAGNVFDITIEEHDTEHKWHPDARYFVIHRNGEKIADFYFDLFARDKKRGGAWMADCRVRRRSDSALQLPTAFLVCNFNGPIGDTPALLTHSDVTTLFHEFGHGLHHMLTQIDVAAVSGINGVAWDAVELPSQFMENFCWEPEVLAFLSGHYQTGEKLPQTMLDNMLAAKNFQSAMQMLRQIEFAWFDFALHCQYGNDDFPGVQALLDEVRDRVAVIVPPPFNKFQNSFSHIFAGGYAAGYYSYKWAEVLSADAYAAFEEEGLFNPAVAQRYRESIIEKGGSEDAMTLFKNFRGREPTVDALLRHSGLVANG